MTNTRIKIRHFLKNNAKIIFIIVVIWAIVFFINRYLRTYEVTPTELQTTYEPHTSIMDTGSSVPGKVSNNIEEMLDKYVNYLFAGNVESAYEMISDECKEYSFSNRLDNFTKYAINKIGNAKRYAIQDYSNEKNLYVYQIKYTEDFLATGITNSNYAYSEEKIVFKKQKDGTLSMSVGDFIDYEEINNIFENEYIKVDVRSVQKYYGYEVYSVRITNRSDYTIVIADGQEVSETFLTLKSKDTRDAVNITNLVLNPGSNIVEDFRYQKFYDNNDEANSINFGSIRVMENYSGTEDVSEETIQSEIQSAVAKFSVNVPVK